MTLRKCECGHSRQRGAHCSQCPCGRFRWRVKTALLVPFMQHEDIARLASYRANNLWATGQQVTRRTRRRLRREARRDLTP